jgi:oligopeptide transport system ATP-binding protein
MIAMALACEPELLIADEPTTALDVTIQAQIVQLVKALQREFDTAVVWITHDLGVVAGLADRVLVMYAGRIVESAPVERLYRQPAHPYTAGLLASLPRLDDSHKGRLQAIDGAPPDALNMPPGCAFCERCQFAVEKCRDHRPPLVEVAPEHDSACWLVGPDAVPDWQRTAAP